MFSFLWSSLTNMSREITIAEAAVFVDRNNAGIMAPPFTLSKDNIEQQFAVNHLGPFLLTNLLLDTMKKTASECGKEGRIINVASELHRYGYKEGIRFDKINDKARLVCYILKKYSNKYFTLSGLLTKYHVLVFLTNFTIRF